MARDARVVAHALTDVRVLLAAAIAAFAAGFAALALLQHRAFETGRFDVGNLTQAVWATAHGDFLTVTDLAGRQISRLGAHFDPIVAALVPLWWAWPDPGVLLVAQAVAVALGAIPVFRLARRHLGSAHAALGLALVYLLYPPTQWLVLDDFHPVAFATPLLLAAWDFLDEGRFVSFALAAGAACLTKEHIGLVVAMLGIWYALARGRRRAGAVIAVTATAVAIVATAVVVPHFAPGGGSPFAGRYDKVGGTPAGILETAVTEPGAARRGGNRGPRSRLPAGPAGPSRWTPVARPARSARGFARAGGKPALGHGDADVDPLPLHRWSSPGACRSNDLRRRESAAAGRQACRSRPARARGRSAAGECRLRAESALEPCATRTRIWLPGIMSSRPTIVWRRRH